MAAVSFTERVNAPVDRIFDVMTNIEDSPKCMSGISDVEILSTGPVGVGTRWKETRVMYGKEATEEMAITEFIDNNRYVVEAESCGAKYRTEFRFKKVDNYTTDVTMDMIVRPITFLAKLMSPLTMLMKGTIVKAIKKDLEDACKVCEGNYDDDSTSSVSSNGTH